MEGRLTRAANKTGFTAAAGRACTGHTGVGQGAATPHQGFVNCLEPALLLCRRAFTQAEAALPKGCRRQDQQTRHCRKLLKEAECDRLPQGRYGLTYRG